MKILFLVTKQDVGGAQKYVADLAKHLDPKLFTAKVLTGGNRGLRFLSNSFHPYFLFLNDWAALIEIFFTLRQEQPDVLHLNSSKAGVIGAFAAHLYNLFTPAGVKKIKTVFTAHGWVFNPENDLSYARLAFYRFLHRLAGKYQDVIINVSDYDRKLALKHNIAPAEKLVTIYNGIDHKNLKFLDKKTARKALLTQITNQPTGQLTNAVWIGSIGRLVREKNYPDLIAAAVAMQKPNHYFFIIGTGPEKTRLEKLIRRAKLEDRFFILTGFSPAAPYLKAFDVFTLSSIKEGLPYTMLEAMAAGVPIVTTRVGGMTEIIDPPEGRRKGIAMPPQEPEELARAIVHFLENKTDAEQAATEAKNFLKEKLALERMVNATEQVYQLQETSSK